MVTAVAQMSLSPLRAGCWKTADCRFLLHRTASGWRLHGRQASASELLHEAGLTGQRFPSRAQALAALSLACALA
jgi:hypothetical protein